MILKNVKYELDKLISKTSEYSESPLFREHLEEKINDYLELEQIILNSQIQEMKQVIRYIKIKKLDNKYIEMIKNPRKYFEISQIKAALISCGY
ncbi:MAG: hypothetical protein IKV94_01400 [Clostridia bacterium]|nr:hypothetical protein [Clostridia bacterium]